MKYCEWSLLFTITLINLFFITLLVELTHL
ncbi:hypothetical protein Lepto7375DRAFT_3898 [Leptolyngbya sp. PCC 7375]|nr:hypothetical protein Lepto7375DRAFT_3898 [Leptolyngbya sp. PCC 7375]